VIFEKQWQGVTDAMTDASAKDPPEPHVLRDLLLGLAGFALATVTDGIGAAIISKFVSGTGKHMAQKAALSVTGALTDRGVEDAERFLSEEMVQEGIKDMMKGRVDAAKEVLVDKVKGGQEAKQEGGQGTDALITFFRAQQHALIDQDLVRDETFKAGLAQHKAEFSKNPQAAHAGLEALKAAIAETAQDPALIGKQHTASLQQWLVYLSRSHVGTKGQKDAQGKEVVGTDLAPAMDADAREERTVHNVNEAHVTAGNLLGAIEEEKETMTDGILQLDLGFLGDDEGLVIERAALEGTSDRVRGFLSGKPVKEMGIPIVATGKVYGQVEVSIGKNEVGTVDEHAGGVGREWMLSRVGKKGQEGEAPLHEAATEIMDVELGRLTVGKIERDL
jgi:hypothetical protein